MYVSFYSTSTAKREGFEADTWILNFSLVIQDM